MYKQASVVESVRVEGRVRQVLIKNLGSVNTQEELRRAQKLCDYFRRGEQLVTIKEVSNKRTFDFGVIYAIQQLWNNYKIAEKLSDMLGSKYGFVFQMAATRLHDPASELSTVEWINNEAWNPFEKETKPQHLYRTLDHLIEKKDEIEKGIFDSLKQKLKLDLKKTFYDLTSSYFEGECCKLAMFGYSRDKRKDRPQIVLGLAMVDGIPIMHEVFQGNTVDKTTLKEMSEKLKNHLGIKKTAFVADRGIITEDNLDALESIEYDYIIGCERRNNNKAKELLTKNISSEKEQSAKQVLKEKNERRYILCLNKTTRKERLETIKQIVKQKNRQLAELQTKYTKSQESKKGRKMTIESLINHTNKTLGKNKRLYNTKHDKKTGLEYSLNQQAHEYEKQIAGKFLLVTNTQLKANKVMEAYKELQTVENAFKEIKNFLDIRPIYHWKERRVKAHVFICVLAFLTECIIGKLTQKPPRKIIRTLKRIKISAHNINGETIQLVDKPTKQETTFFKKMGVQIPQRILM